jgi:hypothetical protein
MYGKQVREITLPTWSKRFCTPALIISSASCKLLNNLFFLVDELSERSAPQGLAQVMQHLSFQREGFVFQITWVGRPQPHQQ